MRVDDERIDIGIDTKFRLEKDQLSIVKWREDMVIRSDIRKKIDIGIDIEFKIRKSDNHYLMKR